MKITATLKNLSIIITLIALVFSAGVGWAKVHENTEDIQIVVEWIDKHEESTSETGQAIVRMDERLANMADDIEDIEESL